MYGRGCQHGGPGQADGYQNQNKSCLTFLELYNTDYVKNFSKDKEKKQPERQSNKVPLVELKPSDLMVVVVSHHAVWFLVILYRRMVPKQLPVSQ